MNTKIELAFSAIQRETDRYFGSDIQSKSLKKHLLPELIEELNLNIDLIIDYVPITSFVAGCLYAKSIKNKQVF